MSKPGEEIFLPGLDYQLRLLTEAIDISGLTVLVVGAGSEVIAQSLSRQSKTKVEVIVDDYDSLINSKLILENDENVNIRLMDYESTDFKNSTFDLIYAQASVSTLNRNKIIKEIKRILKEDGILCVGEITRLKEKAPTFVEMIFQNSSILPMLSDSLQTYYTERNFKIVTRKNLSFTLKEYYSANLKKLYDAKFELTEKEKSYYKKLVNRISHESKAYLNQGADKFIGFEAMLLKKG